MYQKRMKPPYVPDRLRLNQLALGNIDNIDISLDQENNTIETTSHVSKTYSATGGTRSNIR